MHRKRARYGVLSADIPLLDGTAITAANLVLYAHTVSEYTKTMTDNLLPETVSIDFAERAFPKARTRPVIVIVDDVLNSGKHFKVAQSLIKGRYADAEIRGVFLARCVRQPAEFEVPPDG